MLILEDFKKEMISFCSEKKYEELSMTVKSFEDTEFSMILGTP